MKCGSWSEQLISTFRFFNGNGTMAVQMLCWSQKTTFDEAFSCGVPLMDAVSLCHHLLHPHHSRVGLQTVPMPDLMLSLGELPFEILGLFGRVRVT